MACAVMAAKPFKEYGGPGGITNPNRENLSLILAVSFTIIAEVE
jgi:hypothetical protein